MAYDKTEVDRLKAEAVKTTAKADECLKSIEAMFATDVAWTEADTRKYERLKAQYDWANGQAWRMSAQASAIEETRPKTDEELEAIRSKPMTRWARKGAQGLSADERIEQQNRLDTFGNDADTPHAKFVVPFDLSKTQGPKAAVLTPADTNARERYIDQDYYETMSEYGGLSKVISTIYTDHGNDVRFLVNQSDEGFSHGSYPTPTIARQANVAAAQPAAGNSWDINPQDLNAESTVIRAFLYNSGLARINAATFEDVGFDVGDWARSTLFRRLGHRLEGEIMQGEQADSGAHVLQGLWSSTGDFSLSDNDPAEFTYTDAVNLSDRIDEAYLFGELGIGGYARHEGKVAFVGSYGGLLAVKGMKDSQDRPIYIPRPSDNGMYQLLGFPVYSTGSWNDDQDEVANNQHPIAFGNFGYLTQRFCGGGIMVSRFYDSATALTNQVTFMAHVRWGVNCLGPKSGTGLGRKSLAIIKGKIVST